MTSSAFSYLVGPKENAGTRHTPSVHARQRHHPAEAFDREVALPPSQAPSATWQVSPSRVPDAVSVAPTHQPTADVSVARQLATIRGQAPGGTRKVSPSRVPVREIGADSRLRPPVQCPRREPDFAKQPVAVPFKAPAGPSLQCSGDAPLANGVFADGQVHPRIESDIEAARVGGQLLEPSTRERLKPALGDSLEDVRVHADARAQALARAVCARAFTVGSDLFFADGEYRPGSRDGDKLIAHEATHVLQQRGALVRGALTVSSPGDALEFEADMVASCYEESSERSDQCQGEADRIVAATPTRLGVSGTRTQAGLQRQEAPDTSDSTAPTTDVDQLNNEYLTAVQMGDWSAAAEWLNAFSRQDIQTRLAQLAPGQISKLHQGALDNPRVGPQSQVALMSTAATAPVTSADGTTWAAPVTPTDGTTSAAPVTSVEPTAASTSDVTAPTAGPPLQLVQSFQGWVAEGNWPEAAEALNAFNETDIRHLISDWPEYKIASIHQGALVNERVGPQSQVALLTATGPGLTYPEHTNAWRFQNFLKPDTGPFTLDIFALTDDMIGHAWIGIKRKDGQSQTIGFWPDSWYSGIAGPGKLICPDPHEGEQKDVHTLDQPMTLDQAQKVLPVIASWDHSTYTLLASNCTDFAVCPFTGVGP